MAFGTLNSILSTAVSITYTCCCAIVLMLHNIRIKSIDFIQHSVRTDNQTIKTK